MAFSRLCSVVCKKINYLYNIKSIKSMGKRQRRQSAKRKNVISKQHTFGSLIIVLAGIFAVGALGLNSGAFFSSEQASNNLAGQADYGRQESSISHKLNQNFAGFECGYDSSAGVVFCGPSLDGRRFENTIKLLNGDITSQSRGEDAGVIGLHYDGTTINYQGDYVVLACFEAKNGCMAGHESACKISKLCKL